MNDFCHSPELSIYMNNKPKFVLAQSLDGYHDNGQNSQSVFYASSIIFTPHAGILSAALFSTCTSSSNSVPVL